MPNKTESLPFESDAPPADDRDPDEGPGNGRPTYGALLALWRDRDVQYAQGVKALTDQQIVCIRQSRLMEVNGLAVEDRGKAAARAMAWFPPEHGQGRL